VLYRVDFQDKKHPLDVLRFSSGQESFKIKAVTKMKRLWDAWIKTPSCVPLNVANSLANEEWRKLLVFTLNGRRVDDDDTAQTLGMEDKAIIHVASLRSSSELLPLEAAPLQLANDISRIQDDSDFHDVHFVVGPEEEVISANRTILAARSERFFAMLRPGNTQRESQMEEARTGEVAVPDQKPQAFRAMLRYMYSGEIDTECDMSRLLEVLSVAHCYVITPLKDMLEAAALRRVCKENVAELLQASDMYDCESLKKASQEFIADHFTELRSCDDFKDAMAKNPDLLMEIAVHLNQSPSKKRRIVVVE